ncbi:MAG: ABC transporter permease [Oscillospiraceae bacterium]|nr:ABC transporter permease [Oscillospiraceae bacterium]
MQRIIRFRNHSIFLILGGVFVGIVLFCALISIIYLPDDPMATNSMTKLAAPSADHLFGCDHEGRDVLSRVILGSRPTVIISLLGILIALLLGMLLGSAAGYFGGAPDHFLMLISDSIMAFPGILLALVFVAVIGKGLPGLIFGLGIVFAPSYARIFRTSIRQLKDREYILLARLIGVKPPRILFVHLFPGLVPQLAPAIVVGIANMAMAEAGLSYLGQGVQIPQPSLGNMLMEGQSYLVYAPWIIIFPSIYLLFYVLGMYFLSEGVRMKFKTGGV